MNAGDIMTKNVITIRPETTIAEGIKNLVENQISGAPVLDQNNKIVGMVTEKDLIVAYDFLQKITDPVLSFMSKEIISVDEGTPVEEISKLLVQRNIKRVPVTKNDEVIGIVSRRDVLKYILKTKS